jgi:hypothetical protein
MFDAPRRPRATRRIVPVLRLATAGLLAALLLPSSAPIFADVDASDTCAGARVLPIGAWHTEPLGSPTDVDWYQFSTTVKVRALITLGGLAANDRLDLYGACGTPLASSNRPGTQYEEIYRGLTPGTYHLRVEHASGPTSTAGYGLRVRLLSNTVQVLSSSGWLEYPNEPRIVGEVLNNTATPREDIRVRIRFYNAASVQIESGDTYARFERLPARSRSMFVWSDEFISGYDHYSVEVADAPTASDQPFTGLTVSAGGSTSDGSGGADFTGTVNNPSALWIGVPRVMLTIYDGFGRVRNADFNDTSPDPMAPHSSNPYDIYLSGRTTGNRTVFSAHGYPQ